MNEPNHEAILAAFLSSGQAFVTAARAFNDVQLDCSAEPGGWTARQIMHHVADDADLWCFALKKAIASPGAPVRFEGFPGNERWFAALGFGERPVALSLELIATHRQIMTELAARAAGQWEEGFVALYGENGESYGNWTVGKILEMLTHHIQEHTRTLETIQMHVSTAETEVE